MPEEKLLEENSGKGLTRRSFMKGLTAAGVAFAAVSSGVNKVAKADSYTKFDAAVKLPKEKLLWMHQMMLEARHFDMHFAGKMVEGDKLVLSRYPMLHTCCGHEGVAAGAIAAITMEDWCYTTHRNTIHDLLRGMDMGQMMGTAIYKTTGYGEGRGNHFHISSMKHKVPGIAGLIGMQPVLAAGTAYGQMILNQRDGTNRIVVKFSGDGDFTCPDTLIALNEAAKFQLPMIFVCENNGYEMYVRQDETMNIKNVAQRADGFGMPSAIVDGQDPLAVYNVMTEAVERARSGGGPTLVEAKTYRYFDHFGVRGYTPKKGIGSYGLFYRSDKELQHWLGKDPIMNFRRTLINQGILDDAGADAMEAAAKDKVAKAWEWVKTQPNPKPEDTLKMTWADGLYTEELPRQLADCPLYV
jgi:pyruvate dehydrogenase E1 component alpha subunit